MCRNKYNVLCSLLYYRLTCCWRYWELLCGPPPSVRVTTVRPRVSARGLNGLFRIYLVTKNEKMVFFFLS